MEIFGLRDANADSDTNGNADSDTNGNADSDTDSYTNGYPDGDTNGDANRYANRDTDADSTATPTPPYSSPTPPPTRRRSHGRLQGLARRLPAPRRLDPRVLQSSLQALAKLASACGLSRWIERASSDITTNAHPPSRAFRRGRQMNTNKRGENRGLRG